MSLEEKVAIVKKKNWFERARDYVGVNVFGLNNQFDCYNTNKLFSIIFRDLIVETISKKASWSHLAGVQWSEKRFKPFAEIIARGVAEEAEWSYDAGRDW